MDAEAHRDAPPLRLAPLPQREDVERLRDRAGRAAEGIGAARRGEQGGPGGHRVGAGERPVDDPHARRQRQQRQGTRRAAQLRGGLDQRPWVERRQAAGRAGREGILRHQHRAAVGGETRRVGVGGTEHDDRRPGRDAEPRRAGIGQAGRRADPSGDELRQDRRQALAPAGRGRGAPRRPGPARRPAPAPPEPPGRRAGPVGTARGRPGPPPPRPGGPASGRGRRPAGAARHPAARRAGRAAGRGGREGRHPARGEPSA
jgi:hypothetical protein